MKLAATCLQLDVGNSSAKWRLLENGQLVSRGKYVVGDEGSQQALLASTSRLDQIWISSVANQQAEAALAALLVGHWHIEPWFARTQDRSGDLINSYSDPSRMGVDRWLAMLAARQAMEGRLCVVDAGSALTIDFVDTRGRHEGGYIIPGPALMERALLLDTDRVRFAQEVDYALSPGVSTAEAVRHGIALAQAGAVGLALDRMGTEPPRLVFCGGGARVLMQLVGRGGDFLPDLVFDGLEVMASLADA